MLDDKRRASANDRGDPYGKPLFRAGIFGGAAWTTAGARQAPISGPQGGGTSRYLCRSAAQTMADVAVARDVRTELCRRRCYGGMVVDTGPIK